MRRHTHYYLGQYLSHQYLTDISPIKVQAFLFGCMQPDLNPFTYCKGSLQKRFLRGHNFHNAQPYMKRLTHRLFRKSHPGILYYYSLGKLVHYTADAFTYAHQNQYPGNLKNHREYEALLHHYFLQHLYHSVSQARPETEDFMAYLAMLHRNYSAQVPGIHNDTAFIIHACSSLMFCLHP